MREDDLEEADWINKGQGQLIAIDLTEGLRHDFAKEQNGKDKDDRHISRGHRVIRAPNLIRQKGADDWGNQGSEVVTKEDGRDGLFVIIREAQGSFSNLRAGFGFLLQTESIDGGIKQSSSFALLVFRRFSDFADQFLKYVFGGNHAKDFVFFPDDGNLGFVVAEAFD